MPRRAHRAARQQQVATTRSSRPSRRGSGGSCSTPSRRSSASRTSPTSWAGASLCRSASRSASRRTPTSSSRPPTRTRSSGWRSPAGQAAEAVRRVLKLDSLELIGIHSHIGSQIFDTSGFEVAAHRVVGLLEEIRDEHGVELPEIDLGGGLGIAYTPEDDPREPHEIAKSLREIVAASAGERGWPCRGCRSSRDGPSSGRPPSRSTRWARSSTLEGLRTYVSVDGGMSDNIRTALYDAEYSVVARLPDLRPPSRCSPGWSASTARAATSSCGTRSCRRTWRPATCSPCPATGAYCRSMASNYNHALRPPVVAVRGRRGAGDHPPGDGGGSPATGCRLARYTIPHTGPSVESPDRYVRLTRTGKK